MEFSMKTIENKSEAELLVEIGGAEREIELFVERHQCFMTKKPEKEARNLLKIYDETRIQAYSAVLRSYDLNSMEENMKKNYHHIRKIARLHPIEL